MSVLPSMILITSPKDKRQHLSSLDEVCKPIPGSVDEIKPIRLATANSPII